jgi:hypothetical protein
VGSKSCGCSCKYLLLVAPCSTFLWFGNELELGLSHVAISDNEFVHGCVPSRIDFCIGNLHTVSLYLFLGFEPQIGKQAHFTVFRSLQYGQI